MEFLTPVDTPAESLVVPKLDGESGQPQVLDDDATRLAELLDRQNASYDRVWTKVAEVYPRWLPVKCNSLRRAILLASSATQHRTKAFEVSRRGRLVCLRLIPSEAPPVAAAS